MLLVLATGTIQAVHSHPVGDISHTDCALCLTAHVAVEVAQPPVALIVAAVVSAVEVFDPSTRMKTFSRLHFTPARRLLTLFSLRTTSKTRL
ncbi:hypothetical protein RBB78_19110 [Tunturiibacter empetritectus]|uniref:hypothetical protein n=1 Tax=Tunturiibacter empetritectus TaxID=3069691 RepID=UPI003D9AC813